jgi:endogenous inhibitor of DNA gyrase (YacG/DUF329 family)
MIDLGQWADESYAVPEAAPDDFAGRGDHGDES